MTTATKLPTGTRVIIDPDSFPRYRGVVFTIHHYLVKNVEITPVGGGKRVRIDPVYVLPAPEKTEAGGEAELVTKIASEMYVMGEVVRVSGRGWKQPADKLYVVLTDKVTDVKLVALGGEGGRYWPRVPKTYLTRVDVTKISL